MFLLLKRKLIITWKIADKMADHQRIELCLGKLLYHYSFHYQHMLFVVWTIPYSISGIRTSIFLKLV
jgi:hypothetical protein